MPLLVREQPYAPQTLRDYQQRAVNAIRDAWARGEQLPLAALATGGGKTTIMAELLRQTVEPRHERALVIGHTEEIIGQIYDRVRNQFDGALDSYFGDYAAPGIGIVMADNDDASARIVVATRQSLHVKRLRRLLRFGAFDRVIIDECHHATDWNSYGDIIKVLREANPKLLICGLTATPLRGDEQALGSVFTSICYEWLIPEGITQGYLVPVTRIKVTTEVSLADVKSAHGDYVQNKLVSVLETANWQDLCVRAYREHVRDTGRKALAFLPGVAMSEDFVTLLRADGVAAAHLDGETPKDERRQILRDYREGRIQVISNMGVLTEGFDAPETSAIFFARPTRSRTLFTQIVGRGLRPYPGKHDCLLVDMTVHDTRALEIGSLLGKMVTCPKCDAQHYAGMPACPQCGYERTWKERLKQGETAAPAGDLSEGRGLLANYTSLFEKAFAAWYSGPDGFLSCTLNFEDGAFLIVPPLEDNFYRLAYVPKEREKPIEYVVRNEDLASLMLDADNRVRQRAGNTAQKDAAWREHPATMAQIQLLSKWKIHVPAGLSKGAASQLITHASAVRRLTQE